MVRPDSTPERPAPTRSNYAGGVGAETTFAAGTLHALQYTLRLGSPGLRPPAGHQDGAPGYSSGVRRYASGAVPGCPAGGKRSRKQNDGNRRKSERVGRFHAVQHTGNEGRVRVRAAAQPAATPSPASSAPLPSPFPLFFPRPHLPINIGGKNSNTRTGNARPGGTLLRGLLRRLIAPSCFGGGSER